MRADWRELRGPKPVVNPEPTTKPHPVGVGVGVMGHGVGGGGIQGVNTSAVAVVKPPSKPPEQMISSLPEMNAPDGNERDVFISAERDQVSEAGTYTSVRPVVVGSKGLRSMFARSKVLTGALLAKAEAASVESRAALAEPGPAPAADAALVGTFPGARNGLPPPKAKSASSATALARTLA